MKTSKFKFFLMALLFVLPFALASCTDDDDDDDDTEGLQGELVGTWKVTESDGSFELLQIKKNGKFIDVYYDAEDEDYDVSEGTWSRDGNILTVTIEIDDCDDGDDDETETNIIVISKITASELVLTDMQTAITWTRVSDSEINKYLK